MPKWIITNDPNAASQDVIWYLEGSNATAAATLSEKSLEAGQPLYIWELQGHTELDVGITLVEDNGE